MLVNADAETAFAAQVAAATFGEDRVDLQGPLQTGSEDFAFMLEQVPGSYLLIGNGVAQGTQGACMVHNPGYDFNDDNIAVGATFEPTWGADERESSRAAWRSALNRSRA